MKIGLVHFRVGETDGVSLEMEKQIQVLSHAGIESVRIAGETKGVEAVLVDGLAMNDPENLDFVRAAFEDLGACTPDTLESRVVEKAIRIEQEMTQIIQNERLDGLIVHNIWALGWNLPAAIGIAKAVEATGIHAVGHHHDFYWERERYAHPTTPFIQSIQDRFLPPQGSHFSHFVINRIAQRALKEKKGIESTVVPNVMDFDAPLWESDSYNQSIRPRLGIAMHDMVFLQATRILPRKGIEMAFDFIEAFNSRFMEHYRHCQYHVIDRRSFFHPDSKVHFVLCGYAEEQDREYLQRLESKAANQSYQVHFCSDMVAQQRDPQKNLFSLWDMYTISDVVTYPSVQEGWGNQLLEAVFARKLILGYEYPVFETDIAPAGIRIISLGKQASKTDQGYVVPQQDMQQALDKLESCLFKPDLSQEMIMRNVEIGKSHFSTHVLSELLLKTLHSHDSRT